jgi:hypothetical protein
MQDADAACVKLSHHFGTELTSQRGSSESCPTSHREEVLSLLELPTDKTWRENEA